MWLAVLKHLIQYRYIGVLGLLYANKVLQYNPHAHRMQCLTPLKHRAMHARGKGRQSHAENSNEPYEPNHLKRREIE